MKFSQKGSRAQAVHAEQLRPTNPEGGRYIAHREREQNSARALEYADPVVFCFGSGRLVETLDFWRVRSAWDLRVLGRPCRRLMVYPARISLEGSSPGGIRYWWDQSAKREQVGGVQNCVCTPGSQLL